MKILILGATGRTGRWVVKEALEAGYYVHCLVRDPSKLQEENDRLTVFQGIPTNPEHLETALSGCQAVISVLNISRTSDFPWAKLRAPENLMSETIKTLVDLTDKAPLNRIVVCSAWGVLETKRDLPFWFRLLIDFSNIGIAYRDHEKQEAILKASSQPYTIARPVGLTNSKKLQPVKVSYNNRPKPSLTISRRTLAHFLANTLKDENWLGKVPTLSTGK